MRTPGRSHLTPIASLLSTLAVLVTMGGASLLAEPVESPITHVGEILRLSERELLLGRAVDLRAVVTLTDPIWGLLVVQDETGGVQVHVSGFEGTFSNGDEVRVTGFTSHEALSPVVVLARVERTGGRRTPECRPTGTAAGLPDKADARCVEVTATLRSVKPIHEARWQLELDLAGQRKEAIVLGVDELRYLTAGEPITLRGVPLLVRAAGPGSEGLGFRLFAQGPEAVRPSPAAAQRRAPTTPASAADAIRRTVMDVKRLDNSEARRGQRVRIRGVATLTAADGASLFLQDEEAGIYVATAAGTVLPPAGSLIEVVGTTAAGFVAPMVEGATVSSLGPAPMPRSLPADAIARPFSAATENGWIELTGVLRRISTRYFLCTVGRELLLHAITGDVGTLASFVDAEVVVRGVLGAQYESGEVVGRQLLIELPRSVEVVRPPLADPFSLQSEPIRRLIGFWPGGTPVHRVKTNGVVTGIFFPNRLFVADGETGLSCEVAESHEAKVGDLVDVVGFLPAAGSPRRLADALVRRRGPGSPVQPLAANAAELRGRGYAAMLVRVTAVLRRRHHELGREHLFMEDGRDAFEAVLELPRPDTAVDAVRDGSVLRLTGVCEVPGAFSESLTAEPCRLLLRSAADVEVLQPASWWTRERALGVLGLMSAFAVTVAAWVVTLRRRVARQTATIRQQLEGEVALKDRLRQAEKMESIGRLAGGVAHDFNNQLQAILGNAALAKRAVKAGTRTVEYLEEVEKAADRAASLTRQLLAFSRKQIIEPRVVNLNDLVVRILKMLVRLIGEDIAVRTALAEDLGAVMVDPGQFEQVLVNLAVNAHDAMPNGGTLLIETANAELDEHYCASHPHVDPGAFVLLAVTDTGCGMSDDVRSRLFEPFFTTKATGRGTGLGLAMAYGSVKQAGGSIEVYSEVGRGTTVKIYLPRVTEQPAALVSGRPAEEAPEGQETVLLVEDDAGVRTLVLAMLNRLGYTVLHAANGNEALALAQCRQGGIDLLMTDVVMPEMNGRELAEQLVRIYPKLKVLYTSGYTDNVIVHHGLIEPHLNFIGKPFSEQALAERLREVLGVSSMRARPPESR